MNSTLNCGLIDTATQRCLDMHIAIGADLSFFGNHIRTYFEGGKPIDQLRGH